MSRSYVKCMSFRIDEEVDGFLTFLKKELKCSRQQVIEKCLLYAVSRPADVSNFCKVVLND